MRTLLLLIALITSTVTFAQDFQDYKASSDRDYSAAEFKTTWATTPSCIKKGGKIVAVNAAFKSKGYGYGDCSSSKKAELINRKMKRTIKVFKLAYLPQTVITKLKAAKRI